MAVIDRNAIHVLSSIPPQQQQQLIYLISQLCPPRRQPANFDSCRLIIDGRLQWAVEPIDGGGSWFFLPKPARALRMAGCLIVTADQP